MTFMLKLQLSHPDEVSGTTVFGDGTKAYWTEGHSSAVLFVEQDGHSWQEYCCSTRRSPRMLLLMNGNPIVRRAMTMAELVEYEECREMLNCVAA